MDYGLDYENTVKGILRQLGVGHSYQGYEYVTYGLLLVLQDKSRLEFVTKSLYPDIASKYHTSWKCVERNIRTVIDVAWKDGNSGLLGRICGNKPIQKPRNAQFFELMYEYITRYYGAYAETAATGQEPYTDSCPDNCICLETGRPCERLLMLQKQIEELKREREPGPSNPGRQIPPDIN